MNGKGSTTHTHQPATALPQERSQKAPSRSALSRHKRKCTVCHHPQCSQIDQEFLDWRSIRNIALFYGLVDRAVYRHAHALRLYSRRSRNLRFSLGHIIEWAQRVPITPGSIVQAVRVFAQLHDDGPSVNFPQQPVVENAPLGLSTLLPILSRSPIRAPRPGKF